VNPELNELLAFVESALSSDNALQRRMALQAVRAYRGGPTAPLSPTVPGVDQNAIRKLLADDALVEQKPSVEPVRLTTIREVPRTPEPNKGILTTTTATAVAPTRETPASALFAVFKELVNLEATGMIPLRAGPLPIVRGAGDYKIGCRVDAARKEDYIIAFGRMGVAAIERPISRRDVRLTVENGDHEKVRRLASLYMPDSEKDFTALVTPTGDAWVEKLNSEYGSNGAPDDESAAH